MDWIAQILNPIITGIGNWFGKWSTQKNQAKHEERMREYDLMEKAMEPPETLSKRLYIKWFYEQERTKKNLQRTNKNLKQVAVVPENYKEALKEANIFELFETLEQQNEAINVMTSSKKEVQDGIN